MSPPGVVGSSHSNSLRKSTCPRAPLLSATGQLSHAGARDMSNGSANEGELREELGHGGMGVVHRAWDTVLRREVALKRVRSEALGEGEEVERFHREAQAAARLRHPHLVPLLEFGEHEGQHYYTMPLFRG